MMVLAQSFREQFEFDSVDYLNFVLALEKRLEIRIPEIECQRQVSLVGCISYPDSEARGLACTWRGDPARQFHE
jgi:acyl carrier protein